MDGVGRLPGDWRADRAMAWRQLCAIAAARRGAWDATKAKKFALAQYKQLYGDWPRWEIRRRADAPQTPTHTVRPHNATQRVTQSSDMERPVNPFLYLRVVSNSGDAT